jgi:signal transduction histidine kinase
MQPDRPGCLQNWASLRPKIGAQGAVHNTMSSLENIYKKMAEAAGPDALREPAQKSDSTPHVSPAIAHELNNIIAIIRGYADRLLFKHGENPALEPHLKLISEAAKRAAIIIHDALPQNSGAAGRQNPPPSQPTTS